MSEAERLTRRLEAMPIDELYHILDETRKINDDITELLVQYITTELLARKAS